jgi:RNA polymerase sigma-70 factor, ECF subfamily
MFLMQTRLTSNKRPSELTDDVLVQQAQMGDQCAFEILVGRYRALLFLLICRVVQDEHLAHDVLQHVFIQLYRSLPTLVPEGTLRPWLSQVARHCSIDELRRRRPILFCETVDRGVIDRESSPPHHFLQVSIAERIPKVQRTQSKILSASK